MRVTCIALLIALTLCSRTKPAEFCGAGSEELIGFFDSVSYLYKKAGHTPPQYEGRGNRAASIALADGICDMGATSMPLNSEDLNRVARKRNMDAVPTPVAVEALAIIVSKNFPMDSIDQDRLIQIFSEGQQDLSKIAGKPGQIQAFGINSASDRYFWFREAVLNGKTVSDRVKEVSGPLKLVDLTGETLYGIGYARPAEITPAVKILRVVKGNQSFMPEEADAASGRYPFSRFYLVYTMADRNQRTKDFLKFMLNEGQQATKPLGLFPLTAADRAKAFDSLH